MKEPPRHFVETMRAVLERGGDTTEALTALRDAGASMIDSIKVVMEVQGIPLADAKWVVDESAAWADGADGRQRFRDQLADEVATLSQPSPSTDLSIEDLQVLRQALNEVLNGIEVFEFETRLGASREEVNDLLDRLEAIYAQALKDRSDRG